MIRIGRRELLAGGVAASAIALLVVVGRARNLARQFLDEHPAMREASASLEIVGFAYLSENSEEADLGTLEDKLLGDTPTSDLSERLASEMAADFADGRTFDYDGWMLSITECRLCAWIALTAI